MLYAASVGWGIGAGVWLDAEIGIDDPGVRFIFPSILGVGAPVGVYFLDSPPLPRGMPSAIATGMILGSAEGIGIWSTQYVTADSDNQWGFRGFARAQFLGSTLGGVGGWAYYYFLRPRPQTNLFFASAALWGTVIGTEFGAGASTGSSFGDYNDQMAAGGLIGFNIAFAAAATSSMFWSPSWDQIGCMWGGLAVGTAASLPIYLFYIGSDHDPRHGLIAQGVAGALGIGVGAMLGRPDPRNGLAEDETDDPYWKKRHFARFLGAAPMPTPGGMGATVMGQLW